MGVHKKWYVGFRLDGKGFDGFHTGYHDKVATPETHTEYVMVYGPYKTFRAQQYMLRYCQREMSFNRMVQDLGVTFIEKLAKDESDRQLYLFEEKDLFAWMDKPKDGLDLHRMMD